MALVQHPHCGVLPSSSCTSAAVSARSQPSSMQDLTSLSDSTLQEQMIMLARDRFRDDGAQRWRKGRHKSIPAHRLREIP
jgi:hypothetical protein